MHRRTIVNLLPNYAGDLDDRHSTSWNLFLMSGRPCRWFSKKLPIVTLSTVEAEHSVYVSLSTATQQAKWIRRLISDTHVPLEHAVIIMQDIMEPLVLQGTPLHRQGSSTLISTMTTSGNLLLKGPSIYSTETIAAENLTKPLPKTRFKILPGTMGLQK